MISFRQTFIITLMVGLAVIGSFFAGYLFKEKQISSDELPVLVEARNLLLEYGLKDPPQNQRLEYGMIRGMLEAYGDPYTTFSEPVEHELTTNNLEGSFGGIGIQLQRDEQNFHILIPLPDGPAIKIGILEGDRLARVDEMAITPGTPVETIQAALRGKVGSQVVVAVERPPDYTLLEFTIERKEFSIPSVIGYLAPTESRLGILQVTIMAATTPKEIVEAVRDLQERGAEVFALDLRDNYGGLLTSGLDTARLFLQDGEVMQEQYKGESIKTYKAESPGELTGLKFVILMNGNTASAAEIAAGALQKLGKIKIIGTPSYGKDTIQLVFELHDKSSLQVSAARWWIPGDDGSIPPSISGIGLQPDITLDEVISPASDAAVNAAVEFFFPTVK